MVYQQRTNWSGSPWLMISREDLEIEEAQANEEGRSLDSVREEFSYLKGAELSKDDAQARAEQLLDRIQMLPTVEGYRYCEPSDFLGIKGERSGQSVTSYPSLSENEVKNRILGGWLGRAAGCLLGKPVEGKRSWQIEKYLRSQNRWPLTRYFSGIASSRVKAECGLDDPRLNPMFEEEISCMVEDDDTNFTVTGLAIIKKHGVNFTQRDVAKFWLDNIPIFHLYTAERTTYRNLVNCVPPPLSASHRNPYREWIGAQIRGDIYGYINPNQPCEAAEQAWRDASISHIKNGIYGEMWVAAMISCSYSASDTESAIKGGLAQIPQRSRLNEAIKHIIKLYHSGASYPQALSDIRNRWNENLMHHWCHTISNAEIVTMALLWGKRDFGLTVGMAVMPGFDTDCNAATAGSVLGIMHGADNLPSEWVEPLNDTLLTGISGYQKVKFSQMAEDTFKLVN